MKTARYLPAGLLLLAISAPAAAEEADRCETGSDTYTLRYKFRPGETVRWEVVHRSRVRTTVSGTTQVAETVSQSIKLWRVKDVQPDGTTTFEHLVESVDMWQRLGDHREVRYNSRTDNEPPPEFETVARAVGVPLALVTVSNRGEILGRVRNQDARSTASEGQITIPLPEKPVAVGDSWSVPYEINVPLGGGAIRRVKTVQKFTLSDVKTGVATIQVATTILTPIHDPTIEAQLIQRESRGTVRFDLDAGRVIGQQMDVDKRVVGFRGQASSLHYLTRFTEELLPEEVQTADRSRKTAR